VFEGFSLRPSSFIEAIIEKIVQGKLEDIEFNEIFGSKE
jgi:hypothetical protein